MVGSLTGLRGTGPDELLKSSEAKGILDHQEQSKSYNEDVNHLLSDNVGTRSWNNHDIITTATTTPDVGTYIHNHVGFEGSVPDIQGHGYGNNGDINMMGGWGRCRRRRWQCWR